MHVQFLSKFEDETLIYNHCAKRHLVSAQMHQYYDRHFHTLYEVLFVKEGSISYLVNGEVYPIRPNTLIFTRADQVHCIQACTDCIYDRYDLLFDPALLTSGSLEQIPENVHVLSFDSDPIVIQLFDRMDYYCQKLSGLQLRQMLYRLLDELFINVLLLVQPPVKAADPKLRPMTQLALAYLDEYLLSSTVQESICKELGICKSYLHRLFSEDLNTTPKRYITKRRLTLAQLEIYDGAKATAIYCKYGFADYSSFFRAYKKQFGCAPSDTPQYAFTTYGP